MNYAVGSELTDIGLSYSELDAALRGGSVTIAGGYCCEYCGLWVIWGEQHECRSVIGLLRQILDRLDAIETMLRGKR